jgi:hypothetical protein
MATPFLVKSWRFMVSSLRISTFGFWQKWFVFPIQRFNDLTIHGGRASFRPTGLAISLQVDC